MFLFTCLEQDDPGRDKSKLMTWSKKKPCNIPSTDLGHVTGLGCPGSFSPEPRRKKLMKEICREAMGVRLPGIPVETWWGAKPPTASITNMVLADLYRPASIGPENLPQPLEHYSGLFQPHGQSSHKQQVHGQSLPWSAVLPTCIRAESHPQLGLSSCCCSSEWVFRSSLKNQKTFRKIMSKGLLLFCGEQGLSGSKEWSEQ